ncbi:MAG: molybdenum cofactor biosysynthesis protein [Verrucomicrobiaceae bacterium]|nr:MAG: molybdenum cofactor biosysynthesis protein [Verrucomicrobiaceae bacterium]
MRLLHIFISPEHNYFGHHGQPAGTAPVVELQEAELVAGSGITGDRFFDYKDNYKGQVTFFEQEIHESLCEKFGLPPEKRPPPSVFRRNLITSGQDLNALIGQEFEIQGVRFAGIAECTPCYWMDQAFHPGTEAALKNHGGLRAKVLTSGVLRRE